MSINGRGTAILLRVPMELSVLSKLGHNTRNITLRPAGCFVYKEHFRFLYSPWESWIEARRIKIHQKSCHGDFVAVKETRF